jgi:NAD(P)-dependent dehydrogenase (short-subunit alcohol dehydrogenase family)
MAQTIVLTGANRGIGLELARTWHNRGDTVIAVCREASSELRELGVQLIEGIDVSRAEDVETLRQRLEGTRIDLLYNNAGIMRDENLAAMNYDTIREQFEVNTLAPLRVTEALIPCIPEGGKVGLMTSRMGSIEDNDSGGRYGYRIAKAGLNAAGRSLAVDLKPRGIAVGIMHPGFVRTDMTRHQGHITPDEAAERLVARMDELDMAKSGTFRHSDGSELPW